MQAYCLDLLQFHANLQAAHEMTDAHVQAFGTWLEEVQARYNGASTPDGFPWGAWNFAEWTTKRGALDRLTGIARERYRLAHLRHVASFVYHLFLEDARKETDTPEPEDATELARRFKDGGHWTVLSSAKSVVPSVRADAARRFKLLEKDIHRRQSWLQENGRSDGTESKALSDLAGKVRTARELVAQAERELQEEAAAHNEAENVQPEPETVHENGKTVHEEVPPAAAHDYEHFLRYQGPDWWPTGVLHNAQVLMKALDERRQEAKEKIDRWGPVEVNGKVISAADEERVAAFEWLLRKIDGFRKEVRARLRSSRKRRAPIRRRKPSPPVRRTRARCRSCSGRRQLG